jgi:putative FmdB family regulatory protein
VPLYEYQCGRDGRFEVIRKFSDPPLKRCPKCGGPVQRLPSAPAIQFKGTGWYVTDYAKKSGGEGSTESGPDGSKGKEADKGGKDAAISSASRDSSAGSRKGKSESGKSESGKTESGKTETPAKAAGSGGKKYG